MAKSNGQVSTWKQFDRQVRPSGVPLLDKLDRFEKPVLVAGCQRSGTTMLTRVLTESDGMVNFWFGQFPELDAAVILSGNVPHEPQGRYCFQTTHVDDCYHEYLETDVDYRMIWCLRNPQSVVTSMLYNWADFALDDTFRRCGAEYLEGNRKSLYGIFGVHSVGKLLKACHVYNSKVSQIFELHPKLPKEKLMVIDYDYLTENKDEVLPQVYDFIGLEFRQEYADRIHTKSRKKASRLSQRQSRRIEEICGEMYRRARELQSIA